MEDSPGWEVPFLESPLGLEAGGEGDPGLAGGPGGAPAGTGGGRRRMDGTSAATQRNAETRKTR